MNWEGSLKVMAPFLDLGRLRYERSLTSAVTTQWGVNWNEDFIARDLMQNFFDANRSELARVRVAEQDPHDIEISAPTACNLERLFYLGSEKGPDDVGQYGEGFKAAAIGLLRDHGVTPIALSGNQVLCLRIAAEPVPGTGLTPLVYDFFTTDQESDGTRLILPDCAPKLVEALKGGLHHFFHEANPLLGARRWRSGDEKFAIYDSTDSTGHLFYRNLKRGDIPDIPLVLVIQKPYEIIERRIQHDRDRNAFGGELLQALYRVFAQYGLKGDAAARRVVVEAAQPCWVKGHPLLSAIAATGGYWGPLLNAAIVRQLFGDRYFARSEDRAAIQVLRYQAVEQQWRDEGKQGLPAYFQKFGVISAERHLRDLEKQSLHQQSRAPTPAEMRSLQLLTQMLGDFAPEIQQLLQTRNVTYTVARSETVLGELKRERDYRSHNVFLEENLFTEDLAEGMAVFFHEHAHLFGHDGSRTFTDALTRLLAMVVRHRRALDRYEPQWEESRAHILEERQEGNGARPTLSLEEHLDSLSEEELRQLLKRMPPGTLKETLVTRETLSSSRSATYVTVVSPGSGEADTHWPEAGPLPSAAGP